MSDRLEQLETQDPPSTKSDPTSTEEQYSSMNVKQFSKAMSHVVSKARVPSSPPLVFSGDPLTYAAWRRSIEIVLEKRYENDKRVTWLKSIKECLEGNGFQNVWERERVENDKHLIRILKTKMIENFKTNWKSKLETSDRFTFYKTFKQVHRHENYLNDITIKKFRDALLRFRSGLNDLRTNQWYRGDHNKQCPVCRDEEEDEQHVLFTCPTYEYLMEKYLVQYFPLETKNILPILQETDTIRIRQLAMFLHYCFELRHEQVSPVN